MIMKGLIFIALFASVTLLGYQLVPVAWDKFYTWRVHGVEVQRVRLKEMFLDMDPQKLFLLNVISPTIFCVVGLAVFKSLTGALIGLAVGFAIPALIVKNLIFARKTRFAVQITDGLMILSSCLKGGLSLLQSIEALVEELPAPISQEFGLILRENKMGIPLEESFENLNKRMPSEELNLLTTAILVARETGGDITLLFGRLIDTIRAKSKLGENIRTLSMQGKIQGIVMSMLPIAFAILVVSFNPNYFDIMLSSPVGRGLMVYAVISECVGMYMIRIFSRINF
ncbi:type II secretion system protein F [Candidatus Velamenicoccus archaeovorus]|uniref:Type II secretion system protein F n=2 Tax=Velamenicoccus archaeovorus TaxID=1930593 RepID=A0A410P2C2_VELA1|nr:type II secretion system protein F [Candidatus Velamenicoccus archaeovorus]